MTPTRQTADGALQAPYPYFGGKSRIAHAVWARFGSVRNYVEPFFGSGAMLLLRPRPFEGVETVNDLDGMIANFWRAIQHDPESVAHHADNPVNENDLHARHAWLLERKDSLPPRLEGDPEFYDARIAGWWCWGMCCWIAGGWCSGNGPWRSVEVDGVRQLVKVDGATGVGVNRQRVHIGRCVGVNRNLVHLGDAGMGVNRQCVSLTDWFAALGERLRRVRVCCGDWSRVCGDTPTIKHGETAVFLDPPYSAEAGRADGCYAHDDLKVAHDVREWAITNGERMRICLCGYEGEHAMPDDWERVEWKAKAGYARR